MAKPCGRLGVTRRSIVQAFTGAPLLLAYAATRSYSATDLTPSGRLTCLTTSNFSSRQAIGRAYLKEYNINYNSDHLLIEILKDLGINHRDLAKMNDEELKIRYKDAVLSDFNYHRTIFLNGWLLSATEVHISALGSVSS
jgi:hypothetical protein